MEDILLTCIQCGDQFIFTAGEQEFYQSKGFQQPKRCLKCRRLKKQGNPQRQTFGESAYPQDKPLHQDYKRDRRERHNYDDRNY